MPSDVAVPDSVARAGLRLLLVSSDTFPPQRVDVRILVGDELAALGHRIDWILQSEGECRRAYETAYSSGLAWVGATDLGQGRLSRIRKHLRGIANDLRMFAVSRKRGCDILIVKDKFLSAIAALFAARRAGARFVYWLSWPFPEASIMRARDGTARYPYLYLIRGHFFRILLYRLLLPRADHVLVQSEQMRRDVAAEGIPEEKMTPVPMGVRVGAEFGRVPAEQRRFIPRDGRSIVYLGTIARVRRIDFLVRVLERVLRRAPDVKLYIVGKGDEPRDAEVLCEEARRLGVDRSLVLAGQLEQSEAWQFVREADVCVSPFYPSKILNSTSPTKLIEYLALGRPVVANDHPEQRQVIEESGGGICVEYDEDAFAEAIVKLLEDLPKGDEMGCRGRRYVVERRSYQALATELERILKRVVSV